MAAFMCGVRGGSWGRCGVHIRDFHVCRVKSEDRTITELNYYEHERRTVAVMVAAWEASEGSGLGAASTINRHNRRNQK